MEVSGRFHAPGRFTLGERAPGTRSIGGWVAPRAGQDTVEKRKLSRPSRESNPGRPSRIPSLYYPGSPVQSLHVILNRSSGRN
jgi:hypothetical protein